MDENADCSSYNKICSFLVSNLNLFDKNRYENPYACLCLCSNWWSQLIPAPSEDPPFAFCRCQTAASAEDPEETAGAEAHLSFAHRCPGQKGRGGTPGPGSSLTSGSPALLSPQQTIGIVVTAVPSPITVRTFWLIARYGGFDIAEWTNYLDCAFVCRFRETGK